MSKKIVIGLALVVFLGILVCGGAGAAWWYLQKQKQVADVGPLAGQALSLPADTAFVGGFNAKAFFASPGYQQLASGKLPVPAGQDPAEAEAKQKELKANLEKGLAEGEAKVGIRFDKDVDRLVIAANNVAAPTPDGVLIAVGRFDKAKITNAVQATAKAENKTVNTKTLAGVSVLEMVDPGKPSAILAIPNASVLLVGTEAAVTAVLSAQSQSKRPLETNASLMTLVKGLDPASGYWFVADEALVNRGEKEAGPGAAAMFPMPKNLTFAGRFEGAMTLAADMADDAAAKQVSSMIEGGLGMVKMGAESNPQVEKVPGAKDMLNSLAVKTEGKKVSLSMASPSGGGATVAGVIAALALPSITGALGGPGGPGDGGLASSAELSQEPSPEDPSMMMEGTPSAEEEAPAATEAPAPVVKPTPRPRPKATPRPAPATTQPPATTVAPRPSGPVRVGGDIKEPRKIKNVNPVYPEIARRARQQGVVILECVIGADGRVTDVKVLRGQGMLDQAAMDAVRQWVYEPTELNGVPVPVVMTVTVNFRLN
jgi:TonB family protein